MRCMCALRDDDPSKARALISKAGLEDLSLESVGWLLFVLTDDSASQATVAEMRRYLNNRVTETAGAATVASGYSDGDYLLLHSSRRADAVLLEALVVDQPDLAGARAAGASHGGPLGQHAGERVGAAGAGPLLQYIRVADARLCRPNLAG